MAVTVSGTTITFNDATVQTTAAGAVTTTAVLNATAAASVGAVGTYAMLSRPTSSNASTAAGGTAAGSGLRYSGGLAQTNGLAFGPYISDTAPAGTWRSMGNTVGVFAGCFSYQGASVWLRIS